MIVMTSGRATGSPLHAGHPISRERRLVPLRTPVPRPSRCHIFLLPRLLPTVRLSHVPLLLPTIWICCSCVLGAGLGTNPILVGGFACVAVVVAAVLVRGGRYGFATFVACAAVGSLLSNEVREHRVVAASRKGLVAPVTQRARIEGEVDFVRVGGRRVTLVVNGHVDCAEFECTHMRVMITFFRQDTLMAEPRVGEYVIADARVRLPLEKSLHTDIDEPSMLRRYRAQLVAAAKHVHVVAGAGMLQRTLHEMRAWVRYRLRQVLPNDVHPVALAILIGDRSAIGPDDAKAYSLSGTAHMFSVSGSHVAIVVAVLMIFSGGRARLGSLVLWCVVLTAYIALTGAEPPAVRAGIMGVTALIGRYMQRDVYALNLLCASVIAMVCISPLQIYDVGFQLSVLATASLIVLPPMYLELWMRNSTKGIGRSWLRRVFQTMSFSASATVGTALPSMIAFSSVAVAGALINPLVIPLLSLAVLTSAAVLLPLPSVLLDPFVWITAMLVRCSDTLAHWAAMAGIEQVPISYRMALTLLMCTAMLWPITSATALRALLRLIIGVVATVALVMMRPPPAAAPTEGVHLREHGIAVYTRYPLPGSLVVVGLENAPRDAALMRWAAMLQPQPVVSGYGTWGRKMAGAIRAHVVGSGHDSIRHSRYGAGRDRGGNSR